MSKKIGGFTDADLYGSETLGARSYGECLFAAAQADPRIVALGADLTQPTETTLMRDRMPERFFSFGIQEANMIGAASGMARCGDIPFVHSFCVFVTRRTYDQVAMQLAYPRTNVKIAGFIPGLSTSLGVSHQAIDDVALMRALPNMVVIEPCGPEQIDAAVRAATAHDGPVYLRLSVSKGPADADVPLLDLKIGEGQVLAEGQDVAILASGVTVREALVARDALAAHGLTATVANFHTLKPFDGALVLRLARNHRVLISVENHSIVGGLAAAASEALARSDVRTRFAALGVSDTFAEGGTTAFLMRKYGFDAEHIVSKSLELCRRGN